MANRAAMTFVVLTVLLDSIGIGLIFPVMPELIESVTGGGLSNAALWGGVLTASFAVMQFAFGPVIGNLSDRFGRRPVMLLALGVMAADYLVMAVAGTIWLLLAGRVVAGLAAATQTTAAAYVADISPPERRGRNFGLIGAALGLGFILGPALGGLFASFGTRAPFWIAAAMAAANLAFGALVLPETLRTPRAFSWRRANPLGAFRAAARLPGLSRLMVVFLIAQIANFVYPAVWAYWGAARFDWDAQMIGLSLAFYGAGFMAVQALLVGPAIRLMGERRTATLGLVIDVVSAFFFAFVWNGNAALAFVLVSALGGIAAPALQAIASHAAPDDAQGELQGLLASLSAITMIVAPLISTTVFAAFTGPKAPIFAPGAPFLVSALLLVAAVALHVAPAPCARRTTS
ncbi:MFS transporter [Defluviimonas sp. 20V17]|uniref:MFS transporter, DHA1 family, tetracycline resistance protein n=1 Tax=Allgaiera indica TaxID=765699 RepID=A0AAN4USP6_9RHOB|nr:tetracycline resistance MFS efflux pump [Allgaiera indica]KDB02050.1 MFS transporter [Defluviimonas sp. 20V17]GHE03100.1 tetracycline resistance MFS efflux pump [Allgaiera indica]SDX11417.1 MFS transporter, DHA1 family, tetracycline resistance protein [Allgaiera indica]